MYCSNCGTQLSDDAVFCSKCGKPQKPDSQPSVTIPKATPNTGCFRCGNQAAHKCSSCGQVFCLSHIAYFSVGKVWDAGWVCKNCFGTKTKKYSNRVKSTILLVLLPLPFLILVFITDNIGSALHLTFLNNISSTFGALLNCSLPIALIAWGVFLWYGILLIPRKGFYNNNFPKE